MATRRLLPLVGGLVLAGATTALTPGGLIAFVPFLAALLPVLRLCAPARDLHRCRWSPRWSRRPRRPCC